MVLYLYDKLGNLYVLYIYIYIYLYKIRTIKQKQKIPIKACHLEKCQIFVKLFVEIDLWFYTYMIYEAIYMLYM